MHLRTDEILRIVDDSSNDWMDIETKAGRMVRVFDRPHPVFLTATARAVSSTELLWSVN
jgi:hypothetical protein